MGFGINEPEDTLRTNLGFVYNSEIRLNLERLDEPFFATILSATSFWNIKVRDEHLVLQISDVSHFISKIVEIL